MKNDFAKNDFAQWRTEDTAKSNVFEAGKSNAASTPRRAATWPEWTTQVTKASQL